MRWLATGLLTAEEGFHRLSHYGDLSVLVAHLATRKDEENLKALREELPDWLQPESELDADEYSGQSLKPVTPFELPTPVLTEQGV